MKKTLMASLVLAALAGHSAAYAQTNVGVYVSPSRIYPLAQNALTDGGGRSFLATIRIPAAAMRSSFSRA